MRETTAQSVRDWVNAHYIEPARQRGQRRVRVRAGDVAKAMGLQARLPLVCGAIGANRMPQDYRLRLLGREGPTHGANVYFTFEFLD